MADTVPWDFFTPDNDGVLLPHDEYGYFVTRIQDSLSRLFEAIQPGFIRISDFTGAVVAGALEVDITGHDAIVGDAGGHNLVWVYQSDPVFRLTNAILGDGSGHVGTINASATNRFWLMRNGKWHVRQDGTAVSNALLAFTGVSDSDELTSISVPTDRKQAGFNGSLLKKNVVAVTANYVMLATDDIIEVNATAGAVQVTLPSAVNRSGLEKRVIKTDASGNAVTVVPAGGQTINGGASSVLSAQWATKEYWSNGANWRIS